MYNRDLTEAELELLVAGSELDDESRNDLEEENPEAADYARDLYMDRSEGFQQH